MPAIRVEGLAEFVRAVKKADRDLGKGIRLAFNAAADLLVSRVRPLIPKRSGAAAASLKASSTQTGARVAVGGTKAPYYPWVDFGGSVGPHKASKRPFYKEGRYLYPTLRETRPEIEALARAGMVATAERAGLDVT